MTNATAIANMQSEVTAMVTGDTKTACQTSLNVLSETSSAITKPAALDVLNYWYYEYASFSNRALFGESLFIASFTVDPSKPSPHVPHK